MNNNMTWDTKMSASCGLLSSRVSVFNSKKTRKHIENKKNYIKCSNGGDINITENYVSQELRRKSVFWHRSCIWCER